ncbi:hypothetical protein CRV24_000318 [Beauveria bassiana]|nr:hypothetical protein CRV24_000318 [Beauveria bassiana]
MERSFKDEDSARASSEFLIEHQSRTRSPSQKPWSKLKAAILIVLFLVGSLELIVLETILVRMSEKNSCPPTLLGELNSLVPNFPIKPMLFRKDPSATVDHDSEQSRNETRDNWLSYMPIKYAIMDRYNDLTSGSAEGQQDHAQHGDHDRRGSKSHRHVDHCFRYLRQSLLCCGDTALEGQDPNTDKAATNGVGAVHICKDFEAIRSWAEDNRLVDHKGE